MSFHEGIADTRYTILLVQTVSTGKTYTIERNLCPNNQRNVI